jgi:hypothetical protein
MAGIVLHPAPAGRFFLVLAAGDGVYEFDLSKVDGERART